MDYAVNGNVLSIVMPDRVSENNAAQIKEDCFSLLKQYPDKEIWIDCDSLKYISSSGLRALLSIQKKKGKEQITLKKVHKEVNEILEMTGFDEIFHVSKTLRQCSVKGCEMIASSTNGWLYKLQKGIMVKVFYEGHTLEEVEKELAMTQKALTCGIPTPISFTTVLCDDLFGILFEELEANSLAQLLAKNPKNYVVYAKRLANFCKELHETEVPPGALPDIKQRYREWLSKAKGRLPETNWNQMKAMVEQMSDATTFVHGDLSLNNVFLVDDELMLIDMGSCGYGHPIFDLQALYASLVGIELDRPGYCEESMSISPSVARDFWKAFLRNYLQSESEVPVYDDTYNEKMQMKERRMSQLLTQYYMLKSMLLESLKKA
ncbi:MAG: phosphotransferase [Eubacterium sp.]|nr:phosphotransferase [Eubacterium sp.]